MSSDAARFHQHLEDCYQCSEHPGALCDVGADLIFEAAEELDDNWQSVARRLYWQRELKREADENFEYYKPGGFFDWITGMSEEHKK